MPSTVEIVGEVSPMRQPANLGKILLDAIDERLPVPGEIVRTAIYERIERSYQVRREDIPEKVETFHKALEELLGSGAKVMEKIIAKSFYTRLGLNFTEHANSTLLDYVNHVKKARVSDWDTGRIQTGAQFRGRSLSPSRTSYIDLRESVD